MPAGEFAAKHGIHPASLRIWRRTFEREAAEPASAMTLVRVELAEPVRVHAEPATLCAVVGPAELRFALGVDELYVASLIAAIARAVHRC